MPHFYANKMDSISYPARFEGFEFICEANLCKNVDSIDSKTSKDSLDSADSKDSKDSLDSTDCAESHSIILTKYKDEYILLNKRILGDKILVKYNKNLKISSISIAKLALQNYAKLCNAKIESSNLQSKKTPRIAQNPHLLTMQNIDTFCKKSAKVVEIGFGSGRHILDLAKNAQDTTFLGIEIYRPSIEQVIRQIEILKLTNLFVINADCRILLDILPCSSLDCIYLHFPVPWDKNPQKRVFSAIFLAQCERVLKNGGFLELRTDSAEYFQYALGISSEFGGFFVDTNDKNATIISKYEARWLKQDKAIFNARFYKKATENGDSTRDSTDSTESTISIESIDSKDSTDSTQSTQDLQLKPLDIKKLLHSKEQRFCQSDYFLHIKSIYGYNDGVILFILFGAYYAPAKSYFICYNGKIPNILGDIIKTKSNVNAINLLTRLYGDDKNYGSKDGNEN